jgi:hypothetical protein
MGVELLLVYHKKVAGADQFSTRAESKSVAAELSLLDEIATEKGLTPLSGFIPDFDELADSAALDEVELPETWFSAADGLRTVSGLIAALKTEPRCARRVPKRELAGLLACLELLEHDLKLAKQKRGRFFLAFS